MQRRTKSLYTNTYYTYNMVKKEYVKKTITILKEQSQWINDNAVNLSRFVQKNIEKAMHKK